jgi:hypothetical protein
MSRYRTNRPDQLRVTLAQEAARLMAQQGISDYGLAKRKAAERLGVVDGVALPKNSEIDAALVEYQRLFEGERHVETLLQQRHTACEVLAWLDEFTPKLAGAVLSGSATAYQPIELHVFSDSLENISFKLMEQRIPYKVQEHRIRVQSDRHELIPCLDFRWHDYEVNVLVFPVSGIRQAPLSPVDGKPERRCNLAELKAIMEEAKTHLPPLDAPWALNDPR